MYSVNVPQLAVFGLDELRRRVVVGDIEPQAVGYSCWYALTVAERVPTNKIGAGAEGVVEGVKVIGRRGGVKVDEVLL